MTQILFVAKVEKADVDGCSLFVHYSFEISREERESSAINRSTDAIACSLARCHAAMLPSGPFAADDDDDGVATRISKGEGGGRGSSFRSLAFIWIGVVFSTPAK